MKDHSLERNRRYTLQMIQMKIVIFLFIFLSSEAIFAQKQDHSLKTDLPEGKIRYKDKTFKTELANDELVYAPGIKQDGKDLALDFYQPVGDTELHRPLVMWIHGGGFTHGANMGPDLTAAMEEFVGRGYVLASIRYRLNGNPLTATADAQSCIRFFRKNAAKYRIDPNRIISCGSSAGGITSQMLGISSQNASQLATQQKNTLYMDQPSWVAASCSEAGAIMDPRYRSQNLGPDDTPTYIDIHGDKDVTVAYNLAVQSIKAYSAQSFFAKLFTIEGSGHKVHDARPASELIGQDFIPILFERVVSGDQCPPQNMHVPQIPW
jgi:hypothetical protein